MTQLVASVMAAQGKKCFVSKDDACIFNTFYLSF